MLARIFLVSALVALAVSAKQGFVQRLVHNDPKHDFNTHNLQEYYGRFYFDDPDDVDGGSQAFFTMLLSFEYATNMIRLHFNMKEPGRMDDNFLAETDFQWNTYLDRKDKVDKAMIQVEDNTIELKHLITVYGFNKMRMTTRRTCMFDITLKELGGQVTIQMTANPLAGDTCIHRDSVQSFTLEEDTNQDTIARDALYFGNLEALEATLTVASFNPSGVQGTWLVTQDDLYNSRAEFKDFFELRRENQNEVTNTTVFYQLKDYDLVGPADFHEDTLLDPDRSPQDRPFLEIKILFVSAEKQIDPSDKQHLKAAKHNMTLTLIYPLDERHLLINKSKASFRASKPKVAYVDAEDGARRMECDDIMFSFQVRSAYIKYILEDPMDGCFPLTVEGKWHLNFTSEEAAENTIEDIYAKELGHTTKNENIDARTDIDAVLEDLELDADNMTGQQLKELRGIVQETSQHLKDLRQKQKEKFEKNNVEHDIEAKAEEQKDWYDRGRKPKDRRDRVTDKANEDDEDEEGTDATQIAVISFFIILIVGACYYYFCVRRKALRNQQYEHVMPSGPTFA